MKRLYTSFWYLKSASNTNLQNIKVSFRVEKSHDLLITIYVLLNNEHRTTDINTNQKAIFMPTFLSSNDFAASGDYIKPTVFETITFVSKQETAEAQQSIMCTLDADFLNLFVKTLTKYLAFIIIIQWAHEVFTL